MIKRKVDFLTRFSLKVLSLCQEAPPPLTRFPQLSPAQRHAAVRPLRRLQGKKPSDFKAVRSERLCTPKQTWQLRGKTHQTKHGYLLQEAHQMQKRYLNTA